MIPITPVNFHPDHSSDNAEPFVEGTQSALSDYNTTVTRQPQGDNLPSPSSTLTIRPIGNGSNGARDDLGRRNATSTFSVRPFQTTHSSIFNTATTESFLPALFHRFRRSGKSLRPPDPAFTWPAEVEDDYDDAANEESAYNRPVGYPDSTIDQARPEEVNKFGRSATPAFSVEAFPTTHSSISNTAATESFLPVLFHRFRRSGKSLRPHDPPFTRPAEVEDDYDYAVDEAFTYTSPTSRLLMDVYGAFSDPVPSGYSNLDPFLQPEPTGVDRTMQYTDPYAAVRAIIAPPQQPGPPSYEHDDRY